MARKTEEIESEYPCRVDGWLNVWDVEYQQMKSVFEDGALPDPVWVPYFCVLLQDCAHMCHYSTEKAAEEQVQQHSQHRIRLDGGKEVFDKRWGYETLESIKENAVFHTILPLVSLDSSLFSAHSHSQQNLDTQSLDSRSVGSPCSQDSSYERAVSGERRSSVPVLSTTKSSLNDSAMENSSTFKFANFFSRKGFKSNLKRTKSVTKLEAQRKRSGSTSSEYDGSVINSRIRTSRSHESLLVSPSVMHSIDLSAPDVEIKPLHSSILGQDHCFQVSTSNGSKYYSCRSAEERQKWIECLRRTVKPNQEQSRRTDNSLKIWVLEAKHVSSKKRYFCDICLDKTLYARTSSKLKGDILFWGEQFEFNNLPAVETVTVNLYREADKKKKKDKNQLLGYIKIPVSEINSRQLVERWFTTSSGVVGKNSKDSKMELPLIRVKARYQTVNILPMAMYEDLVRYISTDYHILVEVLEPLISVKSKEDIARAMVHILQRLGKASDFLADIVMSEVNRSDNENTTFRGNSIATKAMEAYMKLTGEKYLQDTLGDFIKTMLEASEDCEVDPQRVANNSTLQRHQTNLVMYCEMAWFKIINSFCFFPNELKKIFATLKERCQEQKKVDVSDNLISACIFLRILCPAILSPSLFNLSQEYPSNKAARNLTLIAKTIQNLANFTKFGGKEDYMVFMNDFVEGEMNSMKTFLARISCAENLNELHDFDGYIDLGKELSVLHSLLAESLEKINEASELKLGNLKVILTNISEMLQNPRAGRSKQLLSNLKQYENILQIHKLTISEDDENANSREHTLEHIMRNYNDASLSTTQDESYLSAGLNNSVFSTASKKSMFMESKEMHVQESYSYSFSQTSARESVSADDFMLYSSMDERLSAHGADTVQRNADSPNEEEVNQSWSKMVSAAEKSNGDYLDLLSLMDSVHEEPQNSSMELENNMDGSSIGQLSNVASSGYQSFGYSQSSSPIDPLVHQQDSLLHQDINKSPSVATTPLSFSNPLFRHSNQSTPVWKPQGEDVNRTSSCSSLSGDENDSQINIHVQQQMSAPGDSRTVVGQDQSLHRHLHERPSSGDLVSGASCSSCRHSPVTAHVHRPHTMQIQSPQHAASSPNLHRMRASPHLELFTVDPDRDHANLETGSLSNNELSRSAEFTPNKRKSLLYNRNSTDASSGASQVLSGHLMQDLSHTPPGSPSYSPVAIGLYGVKKSSVPQNTVRMGIRSVQRKIQEQEKSKMEYEQELYSLKQQLTQTQAQLMDTQDRLMEQQEETSHIVDEWKIRLEESEERMKKEQKEKDEQMRKIIQRLIGVEEEMRREQTELQTNVTQKQKVIENQERRIQTLDQANARLLTALNQLKERYQAHNRNGLSNAAVTKLMLENGEYQSSSC